MGYRDLKSAVRIASDSCGHVTAITVGARLGDQDIIGRYGHDTVAAPLGFPRKPLKDPALESALLDAVDAARVFGA
ncbi:hypothetical protein AA0535_0774 [Asaia krungthepensis NRIC 0535]|uniref:Uncharacterized protein n=1 Tax=Asaia krungthepensis NRIC 0535 TaxID=1307925 RepID=A0ABQ0PZJ2_9PROT|nr:hypothetical protein AA0535_0774 [Asaia krungthepensis NRIC 0535]